MMTVKEINELTSMILSCEDKIAGINRRISLLEKGELVIAELTMKFKGDSSGTGEFVTSEEIVPILKSRLSIQEGFLADFIKRFEEMK